MSSEIHTNQTSFGKLSDEADSLVIELSGLAINFCELNHALNKPLYTAHYEIDKTSPGLLKEHFINAVKHFQFSKKNYRFVSVNFFTEFFTLCPSPFYDPDDSRVLLDFNAGKTGDAIVLTDDITHDIKLIYAIDEQLKSTLDLVFPHHQVKHSLSVLSQLAMHAEDLAKDNVILTIYNGYIELIIKEESKLVLVNQFRVQTQEDVLYYVLFALEQYHLNPTSVSLCIIGNIDSNSPLIVTLKKYIKNIRLGIGHKSIDWKGVEGMPQHFNYSLINRAFCE